MTTHEVLVKARGLIEREKDWASFAAYGRTGRYCAMGALRGARAPHEAWRGAMHALEAAAPLGLGGYLDHWNDTHSHAEVLAAFDRAIAATAPEPDTDFLNEVRVEEPVACP